MINIFDMMGPVMVGPSSSHTAGAARIAVLVLSRLGLAASWGELCLAFVLFALCYGAFCTLLGALGREELCWLKNIFRKERKPSFKTGSTML